MAMDYEKELGEKKKYLAAIDKTYRYLLKNNINKRNEKVVKKQEKLFITLAETKGKGAGEYNKETQKNLKDFNELIYIHDINAGISEMLNNFDHYNSSMISSIVRMVDSFSFKEALNNLSQEYIKTTVDIRIYENYVTNGKVNENLPAPTPNLTVSPNVNEYNEIEVNANRIINGPKKNKLFSDYDVNVHDIGYLYGLSMDILVLMDRDQHVTVNSTEQKEAKRVSNTSILSTDKSIEYKQTQIFKAYGVDSLSGLLNKYDEIRNKYFEKYSKLPDITKQKYMFSDSIVVNTSLSSASNLCDAYQNEPFSFPPSKSTLISLMNSRIMNGKRYKLAEPIIEEKFNNEYLSNNTKYNEVLEYYNNLAKNMEIDDIAKLYSKVTSSIGNIDNKSHYEAVMQKMFCELIFTRSEIKISDISQYETHLSEIAKKSLNENAKFSVHDANETRTIERNNTIYKEYLKYYMALQNKQTALSFSKFVAQYYGQNLNVNEPDTLASDLRRIGK